MNLPIELSEDEKAGFVEAYAYGLKNAWLTLGVFGIVGTMTCVFAKEYGNHVYSRVRDEKEESKRQGKRNASIVSQSEV